MVDAEEDTPFVEDLGLGRVDVFGLAGGVVCGRLFELPRGKGDDAGLHVANRHHESAAEAGLETFVIGLAVAGEEEPAVVHGFGGYAAFFESRVRAHCVRRVRSRF